MLSLDHGRVIDEPKNPIGLLEAIHTGSYFIHLAGYIAAKDGGPLLHKDAVVLHVAVQRVDGDSGVLDDYLAGASGGHGSVADAEWCAGGIEVCGAVLRRGHGC